MERIERKTCTSADGVEIVYSASGPRDSKEPALVFVHGGLANRGFWERQLTSFSAFPRQHRVIAPDLAGHGESGRNRTRWGIAEFGADVRAAVEAEGVRQAILFGNSLGGPVAMEAALLLPGKVLGVVGVDTFQSLEYKVSTEQAQQRAEAFRRDYAASLREMTRSLFHPDASPEVMADAERRMAGTPPSTAFSMFLSFAGYDTAATARRLSVPLRAINGDLYPTDVDGVRKTKADFAVKVMPHMGHYPMLERPEEFNRLVAETVAELRQILTH